MYSDFIKFNQAINDLSTKIDSLARDDNVDMDIIDHLTKYLIILMSGYIEKLKPTKLKSILEKFDSTWIQEIEDEHSNALGLIIRARNDIAHCNNTNISKQDYIKYFDTTKQMLEKIEHKLFTKI